jgi:hypothetical protein
MFCCIFVAKEDYIVFWYEPGFDVTFSPRPLAYFPKVCYTEIISQQEVFLYGIYVFSKRI